MENSNLIAIQTFCSSHQVGSDFIYSIYEIGLIEIVKVENEDFIEESQLSNLEKSLRLYKDLHINTEGIAAVFDLLEQVDSLNHKIQSLKNRLAVYEE